MGFEDKVVLVTGGSSGIGAATAFAFATEGAKVVIVGRNTVNLQRVSDQCEKKGSKPLVIVADISTEEGVKRILKDTIKQFGKLDVLVNSAGIFKAGSILAPDAMDVYHEVTKINLNSAVYLTHLAAPYLIETKGNIINVSSISGMRVCVGNSFAYHTSKAAIDHFTRSIALELAPKGVRVNTVNPGLVKTNLPALYVKTVEEREAMYIGAAQGTPLKRVSEPEEIADLILFLASDKARSITGSSYLSDNGLLMLGPS